MFWRKAKSLLSSVDPPPKEYYTMFLRIPKIHGQDQIAISKIYVKEGENLIKNQKVFQVKYKWMYIIPTNKDYFTKNPCTVEKIYIQENLNYQPYQRAFRIKIEKECLTKKQIEEAQKRNQSESGQVYDDLPGDDYNIDFDKYQDWNWSEDGGDGGGSGGDGD